MTLNDLERHDNGVKGVTMRVIFAVFANAHNRSINNLDHLFHNLDHRPPVVQIRENNGTYIYFFNGREVHLSATSFIIAHCG